LAALEASFVISRSSVQSRPTAPTLRAIRSPRQRRARAASCG